MHFKDSDRFLTCSAFVVSIFLMAFNSNCNRTLYNFACIHFAPENRAGFTERDTHEVIVYEIEEPVNTNDLVHHISNVKIEPIRAEYMSAIAAFDERIVKHNREQLLRLTFSEPETISRVAIDLDNGNVLAYGSLRLHNTDKGKTFQKSINSLVIDNY